jgi:hypothetical protein
MGDFQERPAADRDRDMVERQAFFLHRDAR